MKGIKINTNRARTSREIVRGTAVIGNRLLGRNTSLCDSRITERANRILTDNFCYRTNSLIEAQKVLKKVLEIQKENKDYRTVVSDIDAKFDYLDGAICCVGHYANDYFLNNLSMEYLENRNNEDLKIGKGYDNNTLVYKIYVDEYSYLRYI